MKQTKSIVYFDGKCRVCSTEIIHYQKLPGADNFTFVDITLPDFEPEIHGLNPHLVHKVMHVRDKAGNLQQGVNAFRAIWRELPRYRFLYRLSEGRIFRSILEATYTTFSLIRPFLPRKKNCDESPYCETIK